MNDGKLIFVSPYILQFWLRGKALMVAQGIKETLEWFQ